MDRLSLQGSVTLWIAQLKAGDPTAAKPLWDGYFARLVTLARGRLKSIPRAASDEEDVALSAFESFCKGVGEGRYPRMDDRDDLWQVLFMLTARKAIRQIRYETSRKRDFRRTVQGTATGGADSGSGELAHVPGAEPSPDFAAEVGETCARLLGLLGDEQLRQVAIWKLEGYTNEEIAGKIGRSLASVERKLASIRQRWERERPRQSISPATE